MNNAPALYDSKTGEIMPLPAKLSGTGLHLPANLDYEEWESYGRGLDRMARAVMWWVGDWWRYGERRYGERARAALDGGWALQTCMNAASVARKIEPSRRREVLPWAHHEVVAGLDSVDQEYFLGRWEKHVDTHEGTPPSRNEARAEVNAFKRERVRPQFPTPAGALADQGPFDVLYADPPWRYEHVKTDSRAVENQYPTMDLDEICALRPPLLDDAVLFLWATSPKLWESMAVITEWGFEYRTCMVWVKDKIGMGYYVRQQHELLLIGKRGDMPTPEPTDRPSSVVEAPRGGHSEKPDRFYELIELMYPARRYGEMFARRPRHGWGRWGNQA